MKYGEKKKCCIYEFAVFDKGQLIIFASLNDDSTFIPNIPGLLFLCISDFN